MRRVDLGQAARWEYFRVVYGRYGKAEGKAKGGMLDEFCLNTGYHRKYAIRLLNGPPPGKHGEAQARGRKPIEQERLREKRGDAGDISAGDGFNSIPNPSSLDESPDYLGFLKIS